MFGSSGSFGMDKVSGFVPPAPVMEQPKEEGGKNGMGLASGLLGLASLIPGPQQPFVAGAAAASKMAGGIINKDPMQAISGATSFLGLDPVQKFLNPAQAPAAMPGGAPAGMMQQATQAMQGGAPGVAPIPSFNGYEFQYNPYQTSQYPFFR